MEWLKSYRQGIIAMAVVAGMTCSMGAAVYKQCNDRSQVLIETEKRKRALLKKSLGVVIDSSLHAENEKLFKQALSEVLDDYRNLFKIDYECSFIYRNINGSTLIENDLLKNRPMQFESLDHTLIATDASKVLNYKDDDNRFAVGYCHYQNRMMTVLKVDRYNIEGLYNIIAHELSHINGAYSHRQDSNCIMYHETGHYKKKFCKKTIEAILRGK